jgi:hypothetical protein
MPYPLTQEVIVNTVWFRTFAVTIPAMLLAVAAKTAERIIYFNGSLGITAFNVERPAGGNWILTPDLQYKKKYRFVFRVVNNSGDPGHFDITNLKLVDLLKPWPPMPHGDEIVFTGVKVSVSPPPAGRGSYHFYQDESYSGSYKLDYSNEPDFDRAIERAKSTDMYVYFIWNGPSSVIAHLPGKYIPQVSMKGKELRVKWLPDGPVANLQPNT